MRRRHFLAALPCLVAGCTVRFQLTENPLLDAANTWRVANGLAALEGHLRLWVMAGEHAAWMARHTTLMHTGYYRRLEACGFSTGGECIGQGMDVKMVVAAWAASKRYRGQLSGAWRYAGAAGHGGYWCLTMGQ